MNGIIYLLGILCFVCYSDSKPNGSPQDSCFYMTPRHIHPHTFRKVFPTKAMGLYNITTSADVFRPDRPIRVTLWGPPFKGFMLVAAEEGAKDWPAGIFYSEDGASKRLSCLGRGDTMTHQNSSYKDSVSVLWYGPENMMSEQIQFIATVVVNLTIYYTNIRSGMIRLDPTLHAPGVGGEGAPVAVTMDPWLSGQSVTPAPSLNVWGRLGAGTGNSWGSNTGSWGSNTQRPGSGTGNNWGNSGTWGNNGWTQYGTGSATATGTGTGTGNSWGSQQSQAQGGTWGQGNNQWGSNTAQNGWSSQGGGTQWRNPGSVTPQPNNAASNNAAAAASGANTGANNMGTGNDWQQYGQGSVTSSSWKNGQVVWNAPGDGRPIWHWNSGSLSSTTKKPTETAAPEAPAAGGSL